ncbi:MAG: archaemetzincin [Planctomycetes bacterium]|jgi:archaemetzincin|nr:archaemetzincin [Planctomycetota bacterium]
MPAIVVRAMPWITLLAAGCSPSAPAEPLPDKVPSSAAALKARCAQLAPLHSPPSVTIEGDWLTEHAEPGQTFAEYLREDPTLAQGERRRLYVLPIGYFVGARRRVLDRTAEALGLWFGLEVTVEAPVALETLPERARRRSPHGDWQQVHSGWLMQRVLRPGLAADAACRIGFCTADLWPGAGWNFVFGEASLVHRVGVWSLHRDGDPERSDAEFRRCLLRALKTATHETGHMFGMRHCTAWSCNLAGANHQQEADRQPWRLCPECLPKLLWATNVDAGARFASLARFCAENGLADEHAWFERAGRLWQAAK